jgi:hypothetical protein
MRTCRLSVRLGLLCTGVQGGCACTVTVVVGGGAVLLDGEDMGVQAAGVVGPCGCVGPESAVSLDAMLIIGRSMCERAAWRYSSCVSGRLTVISSVRRI